MDLKILWLVTLTFYNYCYSSTILPYGQSQQQQQQQQQSILGNRNVVPNFRQQTNIFGQTYTSSLSPLLQQLGTTNKLQQQQQQSSSTSQILLDSYGPVPSGQDTLRIVPPTHKPLPPLQPGSVFQQIQKTYVSGQQQLLQQQQQQQHQHQQQKYASSLLDINSNSNTNTQSSILIPANNLTLYAANLLATSLLDEPKNSNEPPAFIQIGPNTYRNNNEQFNGNDNNSNNKTDLIIVKTQKKSYIIPMTIIAGQKLDKNKYQELYNQRDKLPIAYTVNQFLFFIKPENVNFLNKLV